MRTIALQTLAYHQSGFRIKVRRPEAFDSDGDIEVSVYPLIHEMKLIRFFPNIHATGQDIPAGADPFGRAVPKR